MDKVLQILAVFVLLMLLIWRSIRGREERFRRFSFLGRRRPPLEEEVSRRLVGGKFRRVGGEYGVAGDKDGERERYRGREDTDGERERYRGREDTDGERERYGVPDDVDGYLIDEESGMLLCYRADGKLTVYRRSDDGMRELQELAVPMDCTGVAWDPVARNIYLEEDGDWFVYGEEG